MAERTAGLVRASQGRESMLIPVHPGKFRKNLFPDSRRLLQAFEIETMRKSEPGVSH